MEGQNGCYVQRIGTLCRMSGREIADKLLELQENTSDAEYRAWVNSIPRLVEVIHRAGLDGLTLALEYETPIGNRIDGVLLGRRRDTGRPLALIIELKQWSRIEENIEDMETAVRVRVESGCDYRPHPVQQTRTYAGHLRMNHSAAAGGGMEVRCCQYLHNFEDKDQLFQGRYQSYARWRHETYVKGEEDALAAYLRETFSPEPDEAAAERFLTGTYVFGEAGFNALAQVFAQRENMVMIEDQVEVNKKVYRLLDGLYNGDAAQKLVVISGPPGTGKTVVGMHIVYAYCKRFGFTGRNDGRCIFSMPRSKTLSAVITGASGIAPVYLDRLPPDRDVVVVDEAHRITQLDRVMEGLIRKARIIVVLQDDRQRIQLTEEGTRENFRRFAEARGIQLVTCALATQKRARQLGSYVSDLDRLLYERWDRPIRQESSLELVHWDSLRALDSHLHRLREAGRHVKWYAPYCWPWTSGRDIVIPQPDGAFEKSWNPSKEQYRWYLGERAADLDRVGCIYTAQGLEFDDIGVIWWDDLRWDPEAGDWRVDLDKCCDRTFVSSIVTHFGGRLNWDRDRSAVRSVSHGGTWKSMGQFLRDSGADMAAVTELFLNIYRVLLTRAKGSVHIWFHDPATRDHVRNVLGF